jgi:hypothetical protein
MAQFFTGALLHTVMWWLKQKKISEKELKEELTSLMSAFLPLRK